MPESKASPNRKFERVLVLGDTHHMWASEAGLTAVYEAARDLKPGLIIQVGDLYDFYNASHFPKNPNVATPDFEFDTARAQADAMWGTLRGLAPTATLVNMLGNHDARPSKRLAEAVPELKTLAMKGFEALFEFEGVYTHYDPTEELFLETGHGKVCFQHGHRSKLGDHARYNQMSTVVGHSHVGGVVMKRNLQGPFWELNAGWLGSEDCPVFKYGNQNRIKDWTLGFGLIDEYGPRFCPVRG